MKHSRLAVVAAAYALVLAVIVLAPIGWALNRLTVRMYVGWTYHLHGPGSPRPEDFGMLLNVVLFVPVGAFAVLLVRRSWWQCVALCALTSTAIELAQWALPLDRVASVNDVVTNTLGGLIGVVAVLLVRRRRRGVVASDAPATSEV